MPWMVKWAGPFPPYVESADGRPLHLRRRPRLRRLLPRRHRRDGRPRPGPDDRRRRTPDAPRHHPHAPDRGRGLGRRGADPPVRRRVVAVRALGHRREPLGPAPRPPRHAAGPRSSSTTTATTARSTRRSRCSAPDGSVVPVRGSVGPQVDVAETTRVVEFNDIDGLEAALADGDVAAVLFEPALTNVGIVLPGARLPRRRPRDHPADRHAPDHRRDPHDLRRAGRRDAAPGDSSPTSSSSARRSVAGSRRPPTASAPEVADRVARLDRGRGFRRRRDRRDAGRLRPVAGRDAGDARRGPDRRGVRADDPARRALGGRRQRRPRASAASRGT